MNEKWSLDALYTGFDTQEFASDFETLKELYPDGLCSLQYEKDYELLFAVRLSAQCTDERVNKVCPALFARFPAVSDMAEAEAAAELYSKAY